jgi:DNA polymerase IV
MRKIIHIDMDAFFASIEQRDDPSLRGVPVIVGGSPDKRGVVATASYEARKFGVHSAMPSATAKRLCPAAVFVRPRMQAYKEASREVMAVLHRYTDLVEPVSIDEAYIDVTTNKADLPFASQVAKAIKRDILDATQLTASAGVGPNKFIAKIASDMHKPDGLTVVQPEDLLELLADLPVRKVPGIGPVTEKRFAAMGVRTVGEMRQRSEQELVDAFGKSGHWFYSLARGEDDRAVETTHVRRSLGAETTFDADLVRREDLVAELARLAREVERRLARNNTRGRTVTLKLTYADFTKVTRSVTLDRYCDTADALHEAVTALLDHTEGGLRPVRLLGITVSNLEADEKRDEVEESGVRQLLFPFARNPKDALG